MATTVTIPLVTVPVGTSWVPVAGGAAVNDAFTQAIITIDRTVAGGLNSLDASTTFQMTVYQSNDGGVTWVERASGTVLGGIRLDKFTGLPEDHSGLGVSLNAGTGRQARVRVVVTGSASVAVAGTLVLS